MAGSTLSVAFKESVLPRPYDTRGWASPAEAWTKAREATQTKPNQTMVNESLNTKSENGKFLYVKRLNTKSENEKFELSAEITFDSPFPFVICKIRWYSPKMVKESSDMKSDGRKGYLLEQIVW